MTDSESPQTHDALHTVRKASKPSGLAAFAAVVSPGTAHDSFQIGNGARRITEQHTTLQDPEKNIALFYMKNALETHGASLPSLEPSSATANSSSASSLSVSISLAPPGRVPGGKTDRMLMQEQRRNKVLGSRVEEGKIQKDWKDDAHMRAQFHRDRLSPSARRRRLLTEEYWRACVVDYSRDAALYQDGEYAPAWEERYLIEYGPTYFRWRFAGAIGRDHEFVCLRTMMTWLYDMYSAVLALCHDNGKSCGVRVLITGGMYDRFYGVVMMVAEEHNVRRSLKEKTWFGLLEVRMMLNGILTGTHNGFQVKLQTAVALLLFFYTALRGGSLAASEATYKEQGRYMKLSDLEIRREGCMNFVVILTVMWRKCEMKGAVVPKKYRLDPVKLHQNVVFEPSLYIIALLHSRGCFGNKTMADIRDEKSALLDIDPSKLDEPLFLKADPGGRTLLSGQPTRSHALSSSLRHIAAKVNLPPIGSSAFRREALNDFVLAYGPETARVIAIHRQEGGTLHDFYTRGAENYNIVETRMREDGVNMILRTRHDRNTEAVKVLFFKGPTAQTGDVLNDTIEAAKIVLTPEQDQAAKDSVEVIAVQDQIDQHWAALIRSVYPVCSGRHTAQQLAEIFKSSTKYKIIDVEAAEKARAALIPLFRDLGKALKIARRGIRKEIYRSRYLERRANDTFVSRDRALQEHQKPLPILETLALGIEPSSSAMTIASPAAPEIAPVTERRALCGAHITSADEDEGCVDDDEVDDDNVVADMDNFHKLMGKGANLREVTLQSRDYKPKQKPDSDLFTPAPLSADASDASDLSTSELLGEDLVVRRDSELLKTVSIEELRFMLLSYLTTAVQTDNARSEGFRKQDGKLYCTRDGCDFSIYTPEAMRIHIAVGHHPWRVDMDSCVQPTKPKQKKSYVCPSLDCNAVAKSVLDMEKHCYFACGDSEFFRSQRDDYYIKLLAVKGAGPESIRGKSHVRQRDSIFDVPKSKKPRNISVANRAAWSGKYEEQDILKRIVKYSADEFIARAKELKMDVPENFRSIYAILVELAFLERED